MFIINILIILVRRPSLYVRIINMVQALKGLIVASFRFYNSYQLGYTFIYYCELHPSSLYNILCQQQIHVGISTCSVSVNSHLSFDFLSFLSS